MQQAPSVVFFFFKQKTAYEMQRGLVGSEMCIRDRSCPQLLPTQSRVQEIEILFTERNKYVVGAICDSPDNRRVYVCPQALTFTISQFSTFMIIHSCISPVSYTHLTLPTILLVQISVVAVSLKKKTRTNNHYAPFL
eukprot:TRINITY_DN11935_c0_g1_i2.p2 TRINITY_DN11935_c0_g1~~TRINITY_DN11935_c0_g1_i2.p2  ORF type:complete len:137 (+),score=25.72 TRINITY_DN11935_c0_g1_i2:57-467(+)